MPVAGGTQGAKRNLRKGFTEEKIPALAPEIEMLTR